jgi:hypothetical protein
MILQIKQNKAKERHAAYKLEKGLGRSNLGKPAIHQRDGEISGLRWVLEGGEESK